MNCSICGLEIKAEISGWKEGNNAAPVNDGRCCDTCNTSVVIPRRWADIRQIGRVVATSK